MIKLSRIETTMSNTTKVARTVEVLTSLRMKSEGIEVNDNYHERLELTIQIKSNQISTR